MGEQDDVVLALTPFVDLLDRLGIAWYVGGSVASTAHGRFRATNDVDVVVNLLQEHAPAIRNALHEGHYVDEQSIIDAVRTRSSFNLIHYGTGLKIDVFVPPASDYEASVRARREVMPTADASNTRPVWIASAEDSVLAKLVWYRKGGEVSERQWGDVQGVLAVRAQRLDVEYLRRWAPSLGVADLLARALAEAGATG